MAARARDWHHAAQAAVCDVIEPWAHGTIVRATRYPELFDFNVVRVEEDPAISVDALVAFADEALAGLLLRRLDFELVAAAEPLRAGFQAKGWRASAPVVDAPRGGASALRRRSQSRRCRTSSCTSCVSRGTSGGVAERGSWL